MKNENKIKQGRKSRRIGKAFEIKTRDDLIAKGWVVARWTKNVEFLPIGNLIDCKPKFNPFTKSLMMMQGGFPDFIIFKPHSRLITQIIGVECKSGAGLDKNEKDKCNWLLDNFIFAQILIAKPIKKGRKKEVEYEEYINN